MIQYIVSSNSAVNDKPLDAFVRMQWRGWPAKGHAPPYMCYHVEFGRSALKDKQE